MTVKEHWKVRWMKDLDIWICAGDTQHCAEAGGSLHLEPTQGRLERNRMPDNDFAALSRLHEIDFPGISLIVINLFLLASRLKNTNSCTQIKEYNCHCKFEDIVKDLDTHLSRTCIINRGDTTPKGTKLGLGD